MKQSKKLVSLFLMIIVVLSFSFSVFAGGSPAPKQNGFYTDYTGKYYYEDGVMVTNCWRQNARGDWFYFGGNGKAVTGWLYYKNHWYYLDDDDYSMYTGLHYEKRGGEWNRYYFDSDGAMATSEWVHVGSNWYYALSDGSLANDWEEIDGYWYYFTPETGTMQTGWLEWNGKWYYLFKHSWEVKYPVKNIELLSTRALYGYAEEYYDVQPEGSMVAGHFCLINGYWYYFCEDGHMAKYLMDVDGGLRYFGSNGRMYQGGSFVFWGCAYDVVTEYGKCVPCGYDYDGYGKVGSDIPSI